MPYTRCTDANKHEMLDHLSQSPVFALDTETTGLDHTDRAFCATVTTPQQTFFVEDPWFLSKLNMAGKNLIFINAKFDMRMLEKAGVSFAGAKLRDISILDRILYNDRMSIRDYSLDAIAKRQGYEKLKTVEEHIKAHDLYEERTTRYTNEPYKVPRYDRVPAPMLEEYACRDTDITLGIYQKLISKADGDDMVVFNNESDLLHVTYKMEKDGIWVDQEETEKALFHESTLLQNMKDHFRAQTGVPYENKKSVLLPIFEAAGETITTTAKGNPQLRDEDLENFTSPAAQTVQRIRHHEKRISTYFTSYLDLVDDHGYIHPNIQQHGTKTGRFSYAKPNLQNIPKDEEEAALYTVRGCFRPRPGNIFLSMDYSQQEYRLMLDYANEEKVIREVLQGKDVHQVMADMVGISRKQAKTLNFAVLYGAGPQKIAVMLGIPVVQAKILRDKFLLAMPNVDRFISQVISRNKTRGYVTNWMGRKLRNNRDFSYAAPNHLIQGGCGDVVKKAMVEIGRLLHNTCIIMRLQVHDQLVFEGPEEELRTHYPRIKEIMETVYTGKNGIVLTVDSSYSRQSFAERDMQKWN